MAGILTQAGVRPAEPPRHQDHQEISRVSVHWRCARQLSTSLAERGADLLEIKGILGVLGDLVVNLGGWEGRDSTILDSRDHHRPTHHRGRLGPQNMGTQPQSRPAPAFEEQALIG